MKSTKQDLPIQITRFFTVYSGILNSQSYVTQVATRPRRKWVGEIKNGQTNVIRSILEKKQVNSAQNFSHYLMFLQMDKISMTFPFS